MTGTDRSSTRRGFSLIEMLIVIVMIGIMAGIVATKLNVTRYVADGVARGLAADLSLAQRTAVSLQMNVRVTPLNDSTYTVHEDANNDNAINNGERVLQRRLDKSFTFQRRGAAIVTSVTDSRQLTTAIVFRRDGTASTGGVFYITPFGAENASVNTRAIAIDRGTGRVSRYSLGSGTWKQEN